MKLLLIATLAILASGLEALATSKPVETNDVSRTTFLRVQPASGEAEVEKKVEKRSYGWDPWSGGGHGHGWPWFGGYGHGGWGGGHGGWSGGHGGWGGHGWYGGWYPGWPWWYGYGGWHGGHGGWSKGWHGK